VRPDDFFLDTTIRDPWLPSRAGREVNEPLLRDLRVRPLAQRSDAEAAAALARLVHDDLERFGTDGGEELGAHEMREALLALRSVVDRLGLADFDVPFRDYGTFKAWWVSQGAAGSGGYAARRLLLSDIFNSLHDTLADLETKSLTATLTQPVSPHARTGWPAVDTEVAALRRQFQNARSAPDYAAVGNSCVRVLEALSAQAFDAAVHLRPGETEPNAPETKKRLDRVVEDALPGPANAELRKLARATIEVAQAVKHRTTPTRRDAGIAADAVIQLANILRRLAT